MSQKFGRLALHMWTIDTTPLATALDAAKQAAMTQSNCAAPISSAASMPA